MTVACFRYPESDEIILTGRIIINRAVLIQKLSQFSY